VKPHTDMSLIRWQVLSCAAAFFAALCSGIGLLANPPAALCNASARLGCAFYSGSKGFLYMFFEERLKSVRQDRDRTFLEKFVLSGTYSVAIISLSMLIFSGFHMISDNGVLYCAIDLPNALFMLMIIQDLILSPTYLALFVKPLQNMRQFSAGMNSEHGSIYSAVILRNTLASASSTMVTAAFLAGYLVVATVHSTDFGVYYQQFFNMLRATDLFFNCLTMFVCTSSLWTISSPAVSVVPSSDDSRKRVNTPNIKAMIPADFASVTGLGGAASTSSTSPIPWTNTALDAEKNAHMVTHQVVVVVDKHEAGAAAEGNSNNISPIV